MGSALITRVAGFVLRKLIFSVWCCVFAFSGVASAQELVPAAYTPAPYGINFVTLALGYSSGDLAFDPSGPIEDGSAKIFGSTLGYARTLNVAGRTANIGVMVPIIVGELEGLYLGEQAYAERTGLGDMGVRFSVNLFGAKAMSPKEFSTYRPRTLIGASVVVKGPTGEYDPSKLINIGANRWAVKPEIGFVQVMGHWVIDAYVGGWFFSDNDNFAGGMLREQNPIFSSQIHLRYLIKRGLWAAIDGNFWRGGQTTLDGALSEDLQRNSRIGLTVSTNLGHGHNLRIAASRGAITRIGGDFTSIGASYGYSWMKKP